MKKTIIIIMIIISFLVTAGTVIFSKYHNRDKMMTQMNEDIQDYNFISCPNGNELDIMQKSSNEYQYSILSYPFSTTESTNIFTFRSKVSIDQKFIFEKIGLLTGTSGANASTDFPNCLIRENGPTRTLYEQSKSAINRRFCYKKAMPSDIRRTSLFVYIMLFQKYFSKPLDKP